MAAGGIKNMLLKFCSIILLFLLLPLQGQQKAPFKLSQENINFIESLPKDFKYGWVKVPENYQKSKARKIHMFYYWRPVKGNASPLIFFNGGPGFHMHTYFKKVLQKVPGIPMVFIDQRGSGASSPLPELINKKSILRYKNYLSRSIVLDAEILRKKLFGEKKWLICGHSFGSIIVQRYLTMHPESIESAHAHGWATTSKPQKAPMMRLLKHKETLDAYFKKYPEDRQIYIKLKQLIDDDDYIQNKEGLKYVGMSLVHQYGLSTFGFPEYWKMNHDFLKNQVNASGKVNKKIFLSFAHDFIFKWSGIDLKVSVLNIVFNRQEAYVTSNDSLSGFYKKLFKELKNNNNDPSQWLVGEEAMAHMGLRHKFTELADTMKLGNADFITPGKLMKSLKKHPHLKLYLYSSSKDSFSPPELYEEMVNTLENKVIYTEFKNGGHGDIFEKAQIWNMIQERAKITTE
jgi:pimeloyl-ACP methyl ester carboxylesterase